MTTWVLGFVNDFRSNSANITHDEQSFHTEVVAPALSAADPGRQRLLALCEGYLSYTDIIAILHDDSHAVSRARTAIRTRLAR